MSQHKLSLNNQPGNAFRADLNNALGALASNSSGTGDPSITYPFQWKADTSATSPRLKIRNAANTAWVDVGDPTMPGLGLIPAQTGNTGKVLMTDGTSLFWGAATLTSGAITSALGFTPYNAASISSAHVSSADSATSAGYATSAGSA
ncbi:MAG: hypothetical protein PHU46_12255, partial [Rhodocyclaceae bacterium]|nr:hypothetical protein [Rhodocyclaceae bacterium]